MTTEAFLRARPAPTGKRHGLKCTIIGAVAGWAGAASADPIRFDVRDRDLSAALMTYANQADVQLVLRGTTLKPFPAEPLRGRYERREALRKLIGRAPVEFEWVDENTLAVRPSRPRKLLADYAAITASAVRDLPVSDALAPQTATIEEVVVTAQKRAERLEDVPISVVAATGEQLEKIGVTNVQDIAQITVGVNISHQATFIQPTIRGITSQTGAAGQDNNVAVYIDGVYQATSTSLNQDLVSVKSMQVLKGPQGTLFGRNSTAGAILIDTLDPSFTPTARARASYGRFNEWTAQGYYSGPLIADTLAFDIAAYYRKSDGYLKDIFDRFDPAPVENTQFRSKLLFTPNDALRFTLIGTYNVTDDASNSGRQLKNRNLLATQVPGLVYATRAWETSFTFSQVTTITTRSAALVGEYDMGWATLKSTSSGTNEHLRLTQDNDGTAIPRTYGETRYYYNTVTQELNLSGSTEKFDWVTGAFYLYQHARSHSRAAGQTSSVTQIGPIAAAPRVTNVRSTAAAVYADGTWRVTDRFAVIGGVRFSYERKVFENPFPLTTADPTQATSARPYLFHNRASKNWTAFTPRIALRYEVAPNSNVYASFSQGFKSGNYGSVLISQANPAGTIPAFYALNTPANPEKANAFEVGFKTAQPRWRFNTAAYYYDYKDLQLANATTLPPPATGIAQQLTNAASSKIYGIEFDGSYDLTENLTVRAGAAYTHARYDKFPNALASGVCPVTTRTIDGVTAPWDATGLVNMTGVAAPCTDPTIVGSPAIAAGLNTRTQGKIDRSGGQMLRSPDWMLNLTIDYTYPTSFGDFGFNASAAYYSSFPLADLTPKGVGDDSYRYLQPSYVMVNAQVSFAPTNQNLTFTVWGKNLGNEVVYTSIMGTNYGDGYFFMPPRTYGVKVDYKF